MVGMKSAHQWNPCTVSSRNPSYTAHPRIPQSSPWAMRRSSACGARTVSATTAVASGMTRMGAESCIRTSAEHVRGDGEQGQRGQQQVQSDAQEAVAAPAAGTDGALGCPSASGVADGSLGAHRGSR